MKKKGKLKGAIGIFFTSALILCQGEWKNLVIAEEGQELIEKSIQTRISTEMVETENTAKKPITAPLKGVEPQKMEEQGENLFHSAKDYHEILSVLRENRVVHWEMNYYPMDFMGSAGGVQNDGAAMPEEKVESSVKDYSTTNVQVEGIAEADIVKTDGEYLYILSKSGADSKIFIVRAEDGMLSHESSFSPENTLNVWQEEMYVSGNRLVLTRCGRKRLESKESDDELYYDWGFGYYGDRQTQILIYDITDKKAPSLIAEHTQDGDYVSSREKDGYLYVISEKGIYYNYIQNIDQISGEKETNAKELSEEDRAKLPQVDGGCLPADNIYFREKSMDSTYTIVTSIRLEQPEELVDSLSFLAGSDHCYMSQNAIYLAASDWWDYGQKECDYTDMVKISYQEGSFSLAAQGKVKGNLDDQFSMDEKDGYLRVVTTVDHYQLVGKKENIWQRYIGRSNSLYVLDGDLKLVGSLENLAEDERVYSVRFLGDTAYFVTFRNTDPLFSVDLSDPKHPVLLGALKIPGFSDYLHPYGENLLLGIGYDAGEEGAINCVKLTMFDISDPRNVVEKHTLLLKDYDTSEACSNHRAVLVDKKKNIIGLPLEGTSYGNGVENYGDGVKIYEDGFKNYMEVKAYAVYGYEEERGFYQKFEKKYIREWDRRYDYGIELIPEKEINTTDNFLQKDFDMVMDEESMEKESIEESVEESIEESIEDISVSNLAYNENNWYYMYLHGVYIGDYFYTVNSVKEVCSWKMGEEDFVEKEQLELR